MKLCICGKIWPLLHHTVFRHCLTEGRQAHPAQGVWFGERVTPASAHALRAQATPLLDYVLFSRFRAGFGGRARFIVSGGAPLSTGVAEFLSVALCCPVFQARPATAR